MIKAELEVAQFEYQVSNDIYFYILYALERADQPPTNMIAIHQGVMDVSLRFPLHSTISHLLVVCDLAPTQLTPNDWSYVLAGMVLLGQVGLYMRQSRAR